MNLFFSLPRDLQGLISAHLSVQECEKLSADDDFFWKEKAKNMLNIKPNYKLLCSLVESLQDKKSIYEMYMQTGLFEDCLSRICWTNVDFFQSIINNETLLRKYINFPDKYGLTLLMYFSNEPRNSNCFTFIKKFIEYGANVNCRTPEYKITPLMAILKYWPPSLTYEIVKMLLDAGANPLLGDSNGLTALDYAKGREDILELLKKYIK